MSDQRAALRRLDSLIQVALRLARTAPTGRVALARLADAIDPEWIPRPWGDDIAAQLESARTASNDPLDARGVQKALREAWGTRPSEELDELDPEPAAVTPTAQVHRAVLDDSPVAVKILRPGLAAAVRQDLLLLDGLLGPMAAALPALEPRAFLNELRQRALEELDLEHEAQAQRRFHRALRDHPFLSVPAPVTRLATESVLVSDWVDGVPIRDAADRDGAARRLAVFVLGAARTTAMHVDPHPDDVLVLPDGGLVILDFGLTHRVQPDRVELAATALEAFVSGDQDGLGGAMEALGWLPADCGGLMLGLANAALGELARPGVSLLDSAAVILARDRVLERPGDVAKLLQAGACPAADIWPARGISQLFAVIARVGASGDWLALARAALRDGWDAAV